MDWIADHGGTNTSSTGPYEDHNPGDSSGKYLYTETWSGCENATGILYSPCFDLRELADAQVHFWYHMYGSNMGVLALELSSDLCDDWTEIWSDSGDHGNEWFEGAVDLSEYQGWTVKLRFIGTTGGGDRSDMAIDDISVFSLDDPSCAGLVVDYPYTEGFESELSCIPDCFEPCGLSGDWLNEEWIDAADWIAHSGSTPTDGTGPYSDHGEGDGTYLYVESTRCTSTQAWLYSPCIDLSGRANMELSFWFHMMGEDAGTLYVDVSGDNGAWTEIWTVAGDQGAGWIQGEVDLSGYEDQLIFCRFRGMTGYGEIGDIAIDDIGVAEGSTAVQDAPPIHATLLLQNVPNPFNPKTVIHYELAEAARVSLRIFDISDRLVRTLIGDEHRESGRHGSAWDGSDDRGRGVATGVYFYRLEAGDYVGTKRMTLLK